MGFSFFGPPPNLLIFMDKVALCDMKQPHQCDHPAFSRAYPVIPVQSPVHLTFPPNFLGPPLLSPFHGLTWGAVGRFGLLPPLQCLIPYLTPKPRVFFPAFCRFSFPKIVLFSWLKVFIQPVSPSPLLFLSLCVSRALFLGFRYESLDAQADSPPFRRVSLPNFPLGPSPHRWLPQVFGQLVKFDGNFCQRGAWSNFVILSLIPFFLQTFRSGCSLSGAPFPSRGAFQPRLRLPR